MKIQIITTILLLTLISLASAEMLYPGESRQIDLSPEMEIYTNYSLIGNTSPLNISVNGLIATITIPTDYYPGEFTISFNGYYSESPVEYVYMGGGGGTRTIYVDKNNTEYILKNDTIYLTGNCEGVCDVDNVTDLNLTNQTIDNLISEQEKVGWLRRFWNWFKGLFHRKK